MKKSLLVALLSLAVVAHAEQYGAPLTMKNPVPLGVAIKDLRSHTAPLLIEAKVDKVCEAKGCWLGLVSAEGNARVTFKDYAFFVPKTLIGKTVLVQGALERVTMSLAETKHYVQDAGGDPSSVSEPRIEYRIVATGVQVKAEERVGR